MVGTAVPQQACIRRGRSAAGASLNLGARGSEGAAVRRQDIPPYHEAPHPAAAWSPRTPQNSEKTTAVGYPHEIGG